MTKPLYLFMILFLIAALTGCEDSEEISDLPNTSNYAVKMGGIFPFTGSLSDKGKPRHKGALLAVKHFSEAGFPIKWLVADSKTDAEEGVRVARDMVEKEGVQVIIGAASSDVTIAIAKSVSIGNQVPQISFSSSSPAITTLNDVGNFVFRTVSSDALQGVVAANLTAGKYPSFNQTYQRVSTLYVDDPYGNGINDSFKTNFKKLNNIVVQDIPHGKETGSDLEGEIDYSSYLETAAQMQLPENERPQALIAMSYKGHAEFYLRQAIDGGYFSQFVFVDGTRSVDLIKKIPELEGMCGTAHGWEETESRQIFKASYQEEYGEEPTVSYQSNTYDAVMLAGLAAYAAQAIGEPISRITIRNYLERVNDPEGERVIAGVEGLKRAMKMLDSGLTINYEGASGNVDFDINGDVYMPIEIWCYESGTIKSRERCPVKFDENQLPLFENCIAISDT